jgi:hypothetical protein
MVRAELARRDPDSRWLERLGAWAGAVLPPLVVGALAVLAIAPGLAPDVAFWDTGEFQTVLPILGTAHPTGYPTYVVIGFLANLLLAPLGEPAFRMNALSMLCVALAAGVAMRLVARLTGSVVVGMAIGLGLALTPGVWRIATHADPHSLHLALVAIVFALLLRWEQARRDGQPTADRWLVAAAAAFALSVGNHSLTLLLALPVGLYVLAVDPGILRRPRLVAACTATLVGIIVLVYLELPLRAGPFRAPLVYANPETWGGFWYVALAEQFRGALLDPFGNLGGKAGDLMTLAVGQFGVLAPLIPLGFVATVVRHPRFALLTGSAMGITVFFNASYVNADIGRYYLGPAFWAWTWIGVLAGVALEVLIAAGRAAGPALPARIGHRWAPRLASIALAAVLLVQTGADFSVRAGAVDQRADTVARRWLEATLSEIEPNAVVVSWWSTSTVLWYAQYVDHLRPDLTIIDDRTRLDLNYGEATDVIARFYAARPVYVIRGDPADLARIQVTWNLAPLTVFSPQVYRVVGPRAAGG